MWPHLYFYIACAIIVMLVFIEIPMRLCFFLLASLLLMPTAHADTPLSNYDVAVRQAYMRETKSQCLARMRASTDEIIVCGEVERRDRYRMTKGGYVLPDVVNAQSPAEKSLETKAMVAASQSTVGVGYTSFLSGIKRGYLRDSYKLVRSAIAGQDADDE